MWRVSSFMFFYRAFGDASHETWMSRDTPLHFFQNTWRASSDVKARHFLFCAGWWAEVKVAREEEKKLMDNGERVLIGPGDLHDGQEKVVSYVGANYTVIVPDKAWNGTGDLSRLPQEVQEILRHYFKNGFRKEQVIVDANTRSLRIPSGRKVLEDIVSKGWSVDGCHVVFLGEFDSKGHRIQ